MKNLIYFDYAASTPVDPRVKKAMIDCLDDFGNPGSEHAFGKKAKASIEDARDKVASLLKAKREEIIWTSGATESNNLALKGAAALYQNKGKHIITMQTEHVSVLDTCQHLEKQGFSVTYLSPEKNGVLDIEKLRLSIRPDTILVSIMHVNNELGVRQDIQNIAKLTSDWGILLHVDAAQSAGKIPIDLSSTPIDLLSCCAHKIYGPKGVGVLYVRKKPRVRVATLIHGGGQEQGMRSGTLPTHQIVGMGEAFLIAQEKMSADFEHIKNCRDRFWQGISNKKNIFVNTDFLHAVPMILNFGFLHTPAGQFFQEFPEFSISSGSACHAKGNEPSYVLTALGQEKNKAACGLRFSFGRMTTFDEIDQAINIINKRSE